MRILLLGRGKMGTLVAEAAVRQGFSLLDRIGRDNADRLDRLPPCDLAVDFSHPDLTEPLCRYIRRTQTPLCCGTTGHSPDETARLTELSRHVPLTLCPNFSPAAALLVRWLRLVPDRFPPQERAIVESHHREKKDAPSGTALTLAESASVCAERIFSLRGGSDPGTHRIFLPADGESLELIHRVQDRRVFAEGALEAAKALLGLPPGLYPPETLWAKGGFGVDR